MNKKFFILFFLFFLLLGNAVAPFILNDYHGDIIPVDSVDLEIINEEIIFNIIENKIEAEVKYEIINKNQKNVGFIFPVFTQNNNSFEIYFNDDKVNFEVVNDLFLKEILLDKWEVLKNIISQNNMIFIDPIKKILYKPEYIYQFNEESFPFLYKFIVEFKENSKNILFIKFKASPNEDRKIYPKTTYSYYYILNTKNYFKKFDNINVKIYYPQNYLFAANLNGEIKKINDKILYEINIKEIDKNLTFSYIKNKISNLSIILYNNLPILYSPYFVLITIFLVFVIIFILLTIFILIKLIKRKRKNV